MLNQSIKELARLLQRGDISSYELTQYSLNQIKSSSLNAFISLDESYALNLAKQADSRIRKREGSVLTGLPMAHKDIFCTNHFKTTCGSKMLSNYYSPFQATMVSKLESHGPMLVGKTNMDEFAMGSTNESSFYGAVKNPWSKNHVPGGSSGGSAAAVAANLVSFATGSDTGGSIRQPAAFCGISGIKPTYGLVSRYGMVAYGSSLDQAGPMARRVEDLAIILQAMVGFDPNDSTSIQQSPVNLTENLNRSLKNLRIGLPSCFFQKEVSLPIQDALKKAITLFEEAGAQIIELDLKHQSLWVPCYYVIACAEASSNLARFDGVRYGHRRDANNLRELIVRSRSEGFGKEVQRRILTGTHVLSMGYFDAYYLQALRIRRLIQNELVKAFEQVDVILGPTTPTCAFPLGAAEKNPVESYLADVFTVVANLAGIPGLSIPIGFHEGLPIGMQLLGPHFSESLLLQVAHYYQQLTDWHLLTPTQD